MVDKDVLMKELIKISSKILKFSNPVWKKIEELKKKNKTILFEGAQGILLDVDHGTYPYVNIIKYCCRSIFGWFWMWS